MVWLMLPAALLGLAALILYIVYRIAFYSPVGAQNDDYHFPDDEQYRHHRDEMISMVDALLQRPCEVVTITSRDGLLLQGRYYHQADGAPLDIGFHGYRGTAIRDFCGGSQISFDLGHNVLLVDQRAQGKSAGHTITFGIKERFDCLDWITWANQRFERPVITLYGVSMGAATVLMATELDLPDNVQCVIADSPYDTPVDIICKVGQEMHLSAAVTKLLTKAAARIFGQFRLEEAAPAQAVCHAKVPILLIHGEDDRFVPCRMSERIARNCAAPVQRRTFPDAGHGLSYLVDTQGYAQTVTAFLRGVTHLK